MMGFTAYVALSMFIVLRSFFIKQGKKFAKNVSSTFDPDTVEL